MKWNNPGNLRPSNTTWKGQTGIITTTSNGKFVTFESMEYGYRAMILNLLTYSKKYNLNTIQEIINRWAPKEDGNDPVKYAKFVSDITKIPVTENLGGDVRKLGKVAYAMSIQEKGNEARTPEAINAAAKAVTMVTKGIPGTPTDGKLTLPINLILIAAAAALYFVSQNTGKG